MKRRRGSDAPAVAGEESDPSIQLPSLPDDILARVNAVLEPIQVRRVYFTEFVVQ